jgi:hypothetical protein
MDLEELDIGPDADWGLQIRRRLVDGAGWLDRADAHLYDVFPRLVAADPQQHRPLALAMADQLEAPEPVLRAAAVLFLAQFPLEELTDRLAAAAIARSELYVGVPNPIRPFEDLYAGLLAALARSAAGHAPTIELMRLLLDDGSPYAGQAFSYLMDHDPQWLLAQLPALLSAARDPQHRLLDLFLWRLDLETEDPVQILARMDYLEPEALEHAVCFLREQGALRQDAAAADP